MELLKLISISVQLKACALKPYGFRSLPESEGLLNTWAWAEQPRSALPLPSLPLDFLFGKGVHSVIQISGTVALPTVPTATYYIWANRAQLNGNKLHHHAGRSSSCPEELPRLGV